MTEISFKPLSESDFELLHQWFQVPHVMRWYARDESYSLEMIKGKYQKRIDDPNIPNFIINLDGKPIGYIQYYKVSKSLPDGVTDYQHPLFTKYDTDKIVGIDMFIADVACLGKHIASQALSEFIDKYLRNDYMAVVVDPLKSNHHAIAFFTRNKFEKFIDTDGNHELMILEL